MSWWRREQGTLRYSVMFFVSSESQSAAGAGPGMRGISVTPTLTRADAMVACHGGKCRGMMELQR